MGQTVFKIFNLSRNIIGALSPERGTVSIKLMVLKRRPSRTPSLSHRKKHTNIPYRPTDIFFKVVQEF